MQELSMNILDIAQNSVRADATLVEISVLRRGDVQTFTITDNGKGMDAEMVKSVVDPFCTTRTTRKVGLGVPFLKMAAEMTGGTLDIQSEPGKGTTLRATFTLGHIDLAPLGDMGGTMQALVQASPDIDFTYTFAVEEDSFTLDTCEVREILEGVPLSEPAVGVFIRDYVTEHTQEILEKESNK